MRYDTDKPRIPAVGTREYLRFSLWQRETFLCGPVPCPSTVEAEDTAQDDDKTVNALNFRRSGFTRRSHLPGVVEYLVLSQLSAAEL